MNIETTFIRGLLGAYIDPLMIPKDVMVRVCERVNFREILEDFSTAYTLTNRILESSEEDEICENDISIAKYAHGELNLDFQTMIYFALPLYANSYPTDGYVENIISGFLEIHNNIKTWKAEVSEIIDQEKYCFSSGDYKKIDHELERLALEEYICFIENKNQTPEARTMAFSMFLDLICQRSQMCKSLRKETKRSNNK